MKKTFFAFIGVLLTTIHVAIDDVHAQNLQPNADIPSAIHRQVAAIKGATKVDLIKKPGQSTGLNFVARIEFKPIRAGIKACPDHYPTRFVRNNIFCPKLRNNDPPASGWENCHGAFYAPASVGCPPVPKAATAPASMPPPRCDQGPENCRKVVPGGPILSRTLKATPSPSVRPLAPPALGTPAQPQPAMRPAMEVVAVAQPAESVLMEERVQILGATQDVVRFRPQLLRHLELQTNMTCRGNDCVWGGNDKPITLPAPRVAPFRHAPCEYEHEVFFVIENRYCPKERVGERPVAGTAVYASWTADDQESAVFSYHRDDYDGVYGLMTPMLLGDTDDRFRMNEATAREKAAASVTAMLINTTHVSEPDSDGFATLADDPAWQPLCSNERFYGLPQPGRCSGVKVGDRLVATSAHCVRNQRQCQETSVVFSYFGDRPTSGTRTAPISSVYQCTSVVASRRPATIGERGADWAIFEVDRDIEAPTATLATSSEVSESIVTTIIGHPMGLPAIVTRLGVVQKSLTNYFITNSDTFVGNSGSAVFAAQSVEDNAPRVLGLLTGGLYDFEDNIENGEECVQAKWCNGPECYGDDVIYANDLIEALSLHASAE